MASKQTSGRSGEIWPDCWYAFKVWCGAPTTLRTPGCAAEEKQLNPQLLWRSEGQRFGRKGLGLEFVDLAEMQAGEGGGDLDCWGSGM